MIATYRLQLHPEFGFDEVRELLPYLGHLGISHLYLSPITEARPNSTHGYDVIDHNAVRLELGGRQAFDRLVEAARLAGLELILDFVPNHAGVGPRNSYWQDVLAYGPHSTYASYFDIDWHPIKPELQGKILLPFLGRTYGEVLDEGELALSFNDGYLYATYYENRYRLNPASYMFVLERMLKSAERTEPYWDLKDLVDAFRSLEPHERDKSEALVKRLANMFGRIDYEPVLHSFDAEALHLLLEEQFWRLSYWKTAGYEINYRRFFDINGLVALRMEDDHVFWDAHQLLAEILALEGVAGVRIDHVDGLFDPHDYLQRLRKVGAGRIWVEKILAPGEIIPEEWPVAGTTGYEFLNDAMGVLVNEEARPVLEKIYRRVTGTTLSYDEEVYDSKKDVIDSSLSSELFRLAYELDRISEADFRTRDFTLEALRKALVEIVAVFDRYRTYLPYDEEMAREVVQEAVYRARSSNPAAEPTVYDFIARVILGDVREDLRTIQRAFVGRFQQYTAPVAAKGVEDTAFYRYLLLTALNEVGGEPGDFGQSVHAFHSRARFRAHRYPHSLLATATHDHKRGEDTRMRLIALSELADQWEEVVRSLLEFAGEDVGTTGTYSGEAGTFAGDTGPSRYDRYLFFQTLVGLWHGSDRDELPDRLWAYMEKATRESKRQTSWTNPDADYEEALEAFVRGVLADERLGPTIDDFARSLAEIGFKNTLTQLVLKMTTPGVPDVYQGCELLDLTLVDPDNRRAVDYERRRRLLDELSGLLDAPSAEAVQSLVDAFDEKVKLYVTAALLRLRRAEPELFTGSYSPIEVGDSDHWIAFSRTTDSSALIVAVRRRHGETSNESLPVPAELSGRSWRDVLTGARIEANEGNVIDLGKLPLPWAVLKG